MKIRYIKVNPVENMTVFVLDPIPRSEHKNIAKRLMDYNNIHAEQVGFVEKSFAYGEERVRLQMMGGEFCGNATRALAAVLVHSHYPSIAKVEGKYVVPLEVSGIDHIINCDVYKTERGNTYLSEVNMPLPQRVSNFSFEVKEQTFSGVKVEFAGITHFIVDSEKVQDKDFCFNLIKGEMDKVEYDAFGIMYYDYSREYLEPLVYVKATDSLFWERSCASGTSALGVALTLLRNKGVNQSIRQPGGELQVTTKWSESNIESVRLNGTVEIVAEGIAYI